MGHGAGFVVLLSDVSEHWLWRDTGGGGLTGLAIFGRVTSARSVVVMAAVCVAGIILTWYAGRLQWRPGMAGAIDEHEARCGRDFW